MKFKAPVHLNTYAATAALADKAGICTPQNCENLDQKKMDYAAIFSNVLGKSKLCLRSDNSVTCYSVIQEKTIKQIVNICKTNEGPGKTHDLFAQVLFSDLDKSYALLLTDSTQDTIVSLTSFSGTSSKPIVGYYAFDYDGNGYTDIGLILTDGSMLLFANDEDDSKTECKE